MTTTPTVDEIAAAETEAARLREAEAAAIANRSALVTGRNPEDGTFKRRPGVHPKDFDDATFAAEEATRAARDAERRVAGMYRRLSDTATRLRLAPETAREAAGRAHEALKTLQSALSALDGSLRTLDAPSIATERETLGAAYTAVVAKLDDDLAAAATGTYRAPVAVFDAARP
jgi:hypothetical protein